MATSFARFLDLPKELRDAIWRMCLPHRIVEADFPDPEWLAQDKYLCYAAHDNTAAAANDDDDDDDASPAHACEMRGTTIANSRPPVVSRVCREARAVALESAMLVELPGAPPRPCDAFVAAAWMDRKRDTLCLHYHPWARSSGRVASSTVLQGFRNLRGKANVQRAAICDDLLDLVGCSHNANIVDLTHMLQAYPSYSVCTAVVVIHALESAAIQAGLFGALGEERVVLVDALDAHRLRQYRDFWRAHGSQKDPLTRAFFKACADGTLKVHYAETPQEYVQDLEIRWLLKVAHASGEAPPDIWLTKPSSFDGSDNDPRYLDYGDLPGRPFARQLWKPNRDHPWVHDTLSRMPCFRPVVMVRLCTKDC